MATLGDMAEALVVVEVVAAGEDLAGAEAGAGAAGLGLGLDSMSSEKVFLRRFPGKHI